MARKTSTTDPIIDSMFEAFAAIQSSLLAYCIATAGPETAYLTARRMREEMQRQEDSIKEAWIEIRQQETQESSVASP